MMVFHIHDTVFPFHSLEGIGLGLGKRKWVHGRKGKVTLSDHLPHATDLVYIT